MRSTPSLRAISKARFKVGQYALAAAIVAEIAAAAAGVVAAMEGRWAAALTLTVVALAIVARGCRQLSVSQTSQANELLSALDFADGLGRRTAREKLADWRAGTSRLIESLARRQPADVYFGSQEPSSPRRLIENVKESAWWSKTLTRELGWLSRALGMSLIFAALFLLLAPVAGLVEPQAAADRAPWVLVFVLVLISQGPWGLGTAYFSFSGGAERIQEEAVRLLEKAEIDTADATELALNYHLIRQGSPVIFSWWHAYRQESLNSAWSSSADDEAPINGTALA